VPGLALGVIEAISVGYVSGNFTQDIAWTALVLARPRGLFGRMEVERVRGTPNWVKARVCPTTEVVTPRRIISALGTPLEVRKR
jgi:hypothetical protein